jgi:L-asparaginase II
MSKTRPESRSAADGGSGSAAPLVEVLRAGALESLHRGHVAVVDAHGHLLAWAGDPDALIFPRSSFKPYQALPVVESGALDRAGLGPDALALMAGSHGGTDRHAALAAEILKKAGLDSSALRCGAHTPYDEPTAERLRSAGEEPGPLRHNCSGKHAGMLLLARTLGAPIESYPDPAHPVQKRIFERFTEVTGHPFPDATPAVDGCSAPAPRLPLRALAHAFALLARGVDAAGRPVPALARVRDAMTAHPDLVAGEGRIDTLLMRAVQGLVSKAGAEAVHATGATGPGIGIAIKIEDGSRRALGPAVVSVLDGLGLLDATALEALARHAGEGIRNHAGIEVGAVRGVARLDRGAGG